MITVGRVGHDIELLSPDRFTDQGDRLSLSQSGWALADDPTGTQALALARQIVGLKDDPDQRHPFTWSAVPSLTCYVKVIDARVDFVKLAAGLFNYTLELERLPAATIEEVLLGGLRPNDSSLDESDIVPWHAVPAVAEGYTNNTALEMFTRTADDGDVAVYVESGSPPFADLLDANPAFQLAPDDFLQGACEIRQGPSPVTGYPTGAGWPAELAARDVDPFSFMFVGDSIGEGLNAGTPAGRFLPKLLALLRAEYPTTGIGSGGGGGYEAAYHPFGGSTLFPEPTFSGTVVDNSSRGLGYRAKGISTGGSVTFSGIVGDHVRVVYASVAGASPLICTIDGGTPHTIVTDSGVASYQDEHVTFDMLTGGSHTVVFTRGAGGFSGPNVCGVFPFDGDEDKGIWGWDCAHAGATMATFTGGAVGGDTLQSDLVNWPGVTAADLIFIAPFINEWQTSVSVATAKTDLQTVIDEFRDADPEVAIALIAWYEPDAGFAGSIPWSDYVDGIHDVAAANTRCTVAVDFFADGPSVDLSDGLHPSAAGHTTIAQALFDWMAATASFEADAASWPVVQGFQIQQDQPAVLSVGNHLVKVVPIIQDVFGHTSGLGFAVGNFDGTAWRWKGWVLNTAADPTDTDPATAAIVSDPIGAAVYHNRPEFCAVTFQVAESYSNRLISVTFAVRRGSRYLECYAEADRAFLDTGGLTPVAESWQLARWPDTEAQESITGGVRADVNDSDGHRYVLISPTESTGSPPATGGVQWLAATAPGPLLFAIGLEVDGDGAAEPDRAADLVAQYHAGQWNNQSVTAT